MKKKPLPKTLSRIWREIRYNNSNPFYYYIGKENKENEFIRIHRIASKNNYQKYSRFIVFNLKIVQLFLWPFRLFELSIKLSKKSGDEVKRLCAKPISKQILEILYFSFRYSLPPKSYYNYDLYLNDRQMLIPQFLYDKEGASIFNKINTNNSVKEIDNKIRFRQICKKHSLPSVSTIGEVINGVLTLSNRSINDLPKTNLFIKPVSGSKGIGCEAWFYRKNSFFMDNDNASITPENFLSHLKKISHDSHIMIQPLLKSHHAIADIALNNICCLRIVTCISLGSVSHIASVLKIPFANSATNNIGLISPVNPLTGSLGKAYTYRLICNGFDSHPVNNAVINNRIIPDWHEALDLALTAHKLFKEFVFLGWDIALTNNGPVILETNIGWDVFAMQRGHQKPLLSSKEFLKACENALFNKKI